jgi:hypothetical protein
MEFRVLERRYYWIGCANGLRGDGGAGGGVNTGHLYGFTRWDWRRET